MSKKIPMNILNLLLLLFLCSCAELLGLEDNKSPQGTYGGYQQRGATGYRTQTGYQQRGATNGYQTQTGYQQRGATTNGYQQQGQGQMGGQQMTGQMGQLQTAGQMGQRGTKQAFGQITTTGGAINDKIVTVMMANRFGKMVQVILGPEWYMEKNGVKLKNGDFIQANGKFVDQAQSVFVANSVTKDRNTAQLRNFNGYPTWPQGGGGGGSCLGLW